MKIRIHIIIWFVMCFAFAKAQNIIVDNSQSLNTAIKKAMPGDTIIMADKEWRDIDIKFKSNGTADKPVVLRAQTPGKVKLTGSSSLRIGGDYLEVHGLWFDGGDTGKNNVIRFEADSDTPARYSRLTNCAVIGVGPEQRDITSYYVALHGKNNRVDHCAFLGKTNKGPTVAVRLKNGADNHHRIDHNYFGERIPLGFNGGETIRVGTSTYSMESSRTIIENNFFEKCNGEMEIISIKSGHNIVRNNLILESEGTITLRHGNNNLIDGNVIIGNNVPKAGGIRMINKGNIVQNNILIGVKGTEYRAPLVIMNGIPNTELNGYHQVENGIIQNNTIINSSPVALAINSRKGADAAPLNTKFLNNLFYSDERSLVAAAFGDVTGIHMEGNIVNPSVIQDFKGVSTVDFTMAAVNGISVPAREFDSLLVGVKTSPKVRVDATGTLRSNLRAGAIVPGNFKPPLALVSEAGVSFMTIDQMRTIADRVSVVEIDVEPGERTLEKAIRNAAGPTTLVLKEGIYTLTKGNKITNDITIKGAGIDKTFIKIADNVEKTPQYIFRMDGAKSLTVQDVSIDGSNYGNDTVKYAFTSPTDATLQPYNLYVDKVSLNNFSNSDGGAIYKAYKGTKADTLSFSNSQIQNSFRGLNLSYEKGSDGKYNAENIIVFNTSFSDIEEFAINYSRKGQQIGTTGGNLLIDHCVFYRVDDSEKGRIIKVQGIENVSIKNSIIDNSRNTTSIVQLKGTHQKIENCVIYNSGKVKITGGASDSNIIRSNPKWESIESFTLKSNSELLNAGTDQKNIGLIK